MATMRCKIDLAVALISMMMCLDSGGGKVTVIEESPRLAYGRPSFEGEIAFAALAVEMRGES